MTHTLSRRQRILRSLVWHPINTDPHDDDRWTVRVWLPAYDILVMIAAYVAYKVGSPLLVRLFPEALVNGVAILFGFIGLLTFIAVCVPRLWRIEIGGKIGISFLLTTYAMLVLTFPTNEGQNNSFVTVILIMATWGIYPRLTRLFMRGFKEAAKRRAAKVAA